MSADAENSAGPAIEVAGLVRDFSAGLGRWKVRALDGLSLTVQPGEVVGVLGPNGSGKSTTLKAILGLVEPSAGSVRLWGRPPTDSAVRARVGYLPEEAVFPGHLTARELVAWHAGLAGMPRRERADAVAAVLTQVGLVEGGGDRRLAQCSKGMRQRAGLATALVHRPELLILDEPTTGLDPVAAGEWVSWVRAWKAEGRTVLLCSHLLAEVEEVCDRVVVLHRGRAVAEGAWEALMRDPERWQVVMRGWDPALRSELAGWLRERGVEVEAVAPARRPLERFYRAAVSGEDQP